MNKCENCKHWKAIDSFKGDCQKIKDDVVFRDGVIAIIYNGTMCPEENCVLETMKEFGCILYEPTEEKVREDFQKKFN